jgi:hypothetical protein
MAVAVGAGYGTPEADNGRRLLYIQGFALGHALDYIQQDDIAQVSLNQPVGQRSADITGTDNGYFNRQ